MNWCNKINLGKASTEELIKTLTSNNIWWRRNAQRLLLDRKDATTVRLLKSLLDTTGSATAVVHALWTLDGFHATDVAVLIKALHNPTAGVRENGILIAELHVNDFIQLEKKLLALQKDPSPKVRDQLLCTLGNLHDAVSHAAQQKNIDERCN
jgi:HEAT repeat protein